MRIGAVRCEATAQVANREQVNICCNQLRGHWWAIVAEVIHCLVSGAFSGLYRKMRSWLSGNIVKATLWYLGSFGLYLMTCRYLSKAKQGRRFYSIAGQPSPTDSAVTVLPLIKAVEPSRSDWTRRALLWLLGFGVCGFEELTEVWRLSLSLAPSRCASLAHFRKLTRQIAQVARISVRGSWSLFATEFDFVNYCGEQLT